jgi:hypothetical protein
MNHRGDRLRSGGQLLHHQPGRDRNRRYAGSANARWWEGDWHGESLHCRYEPVTHWRPLSSPPPVATLSETVAALRRNVTQIGVLGWKNVEEMMEVTRGDE